MLDYKGAIDCFEKALQINPNSASAHFELAWLYDQKEVDPAAAIYHYGHYLSLKRKAENADLVRQRISICKQALAETVYLGPLTEKVQRQFEQVGEENKRLVEQNKRLQQELEKWTNYVAQLQGLTNRAPIQPSDPPRVALQDKRQSANSSLLVQSALAASSGSSPAASVTVRTHSVKAGETLSIIAKKYGVKLEALTTANPSLDARRLKVGQVLRIPGS